MSGLPAVLVVRGDQPIAALLIEADTDAITGIFIQADPNRLGRVR